MQDHLPDVEAVVSAGRVGLLLDLDGTISEMVPEPTGATVSPAIVAALRELHGRLSLVAIITGRLSTQARDIVGLPDLLYVGNHGLERLEGGEVTLMEEVQPFLLSLERLLEHLRARFPTPGLIFEDKGSSFAVHYRLAEDPEGACEDLLEAVRDIAGDQVRIVMGKTVVNVLPPVSLNKGTAVTALVREYRLSGAILLGDDVTDIDSFRAAGRMSAQESFSSICIAVTGAGAPPELESSADFTLADVGQVEEFLTWLAGRPG